MFNPLWLPGKAPENHPYWRKMKRGDTADTEFFLRRREAWCVGACGRFLKPGSGKKQVWLLRERSGLLSALLLYSRRTLLPVFNGQSALPLFRFFRRHFCTLPIYAIQGLREEVRLLEDSMAEMGLYPVDAIDYELMALDTGLPEESFRAGPRNLIFRRPGLMDMTALFELQRAYEKEETIPQGSVFNPAACRLNLQRILAEEQILTAEINGRLAGKINTSARSFTRCQIGGVYVHPDYRGLGIARRMTAEFLQPLIAGGWGISLFVKKKNAAARSVYRSLGFRFLADYRISYY
ncbi:MAG: GNAT family N-acetyltransferase [Treponema sp.]|jgi:ribosomal protein S18 acetylase RimI-like enzyme|nr:GNAT family N-acetyltransferase [Treponema sp.]